MVHMKEDLRTSKMPHIWCAGCGTGIVLGALIRAIDRLGWTRDETVIITGIGCSSRTNAIVDFNTFQTTHGRALSFATGLKLVRPELKIIAILGDGDGAGIGGNHLIHTARRNIDMTAILVNNGIYGMTGGQYSPLTPAHSFATTAPYGMVEGTFDICQLAAAAGASYVGRSTTYHTPMLEDLFAKALEHKGFSFVEAIAGCPTGYGRHNNMRTGVELLKWQRDHTITVGAAEKAGGARDKIIIGELVKLDKPEYTEEYRKVIERASAKGASV